MKKILLIISALCILQTAAAQVTFQKKFGRTYADRGYDAKQTSDGGYIFVGYTDSIWSSGGSYDVYLVKTDVNGDTLWTKRYGGTGADYGRSVQQTLDGGYVICGYSGSFVSGNQQEMYLIKTDVAGNPSWSKTFGSIYGEFGHCVQQTADSGYILAGYTVGFATANFNDDLVLVKTDASGNMQWHKVYGGIQYERGFYVQQTPDGGYIVTGIANDPSASDIGLLKTDASGNIQWYKTYGGPGEERGNSVQRTTDGGYLIAGYTNSFGAGGYDMFIIKTNSLGNVSWAITVGDTLGDWAFCAKQIPSGGYIVTGYIDDLSNGNSNALLMELSSGGGILWSKYYTASTTSIGYSVQRTSDGG
jgi:hypothetical protein